MIAILLLLLVAALGVAVFRVVAADGLGHRPGPRSHERDDARWALPHDARSW